MFVWSVSPIAFHIFGLEIYWYGIIYALSFFSSWCVAIWVLQKLRNNNVHVPSKEDFDWFMFGAIIWTVIGARLGHVLFFDLDYYLKYPFEIFCIRNGGLAFHGSIIALAIWTWAFIRKRSISWLVMTDVLCLAGALGVGIGRLANFMNQELYGQVTWENFGVVFSLVDQLPRYPTQIFEAVFEGLLNFWILFIIFRIKGTKTIGTGLISGLFCIIYSSARFAVEFFKDVETTTFFNSIILTTGQILCLIMFIFGILLLEHSTKP